jgi:hypothetical protein
MTRKALWLLGASSAISVAAVVASQWRDIARYIKIQQMSSGGGPPPPPAPPASTEEGLLQVSGTGRCTR